ncbi:hypothetical protein HY768_01840 [candidate division TA06 bacterium]|uniref:Uncharacterized protein n=1 Tax=candidate division TA06 bacterium TaxID=2250710 RepID=A0A933ICI0_UNCT6|nr:hypothetical protein [candidate division TA06 bacterium]
MSLKTLNSAVARKSRLPVGLTFDQVAEAVKRLSAKERGKFIENLLAATSPEYLSSIKEARADYRHGRVKSHRDVFGG